MANIPWKLNEPWKKGNLTLLENLSSNVEVLSKHTYQVKMWCGASKTEIEDKLFIFHFR